MPSAKRARPSKSSQVERLGDDDLDTHQTAEERVNLQRRLRKQQDQAQQMHANAKSLQPSAITDAVARNNELLSEVKRPSEAVIDGQTMNYLGGALVDVSRFSTNGPVSFATQIFLARVAAKISPSLVHVDEDGDGAAEGGRRQRQRIAAEDDDSHGAGWAVVGRLAAKHTRRVPVSDFMLGPLNLPPKPRKTRKPATVAEGTQKKLQKRQNAAQTQPQQFDATAQEAEPETSREVQRIHKLLDSKGGEQGLPFYQYICHPRSFARSVENLFHLSFLLKEGKATVNTDDESDAPIVMVCQPPDEDQKAQAAAAGESIEHSSVMFEFTMAIWKDAIDRYNITEPMIPHQER